MDIELFEGPIDLALKEDMPAGDITSEGIIPSDSVSRAGFLAKEEGVLAGIDVARRIFEKIDPNVAFIKEIEDGRSFGPGDVLARLKGRSISLLKGERTALNFMQRMSGIATKTRTFVDAVKGTQTKILDTRKTTPGLRLLEKYAVRMGGGVNHRFSLSDMVLIKDNHLDIIGSVSEAVKRARAGIAPGTRVEVEVTDFAGAKESLESGADMIMLDNMTLDEINEVVGWIGGRVPVEVSGNVTVENARKIAALGVNFISVGALTHSFRSIDISLEFEVWSGR